MPRRNRDSVTFDALYELKRHLNSCGTCKAGMKAVDLSYLCDMGSWLTIKAAREYDQIIKLRVDAHRQGDGIIYPCPDLSKHGKSYAVTATACHVTGIQSTLF